MVKAVEDWWMDDGQIQSSQPNQSPQPPDSTGWWHCIDPVVLQNLSVFAQPEKASVFSLYIIFFSESPPKRFYKCVSMTTWTKSPDINVDEMCIFIIISEAWSWLAAITFLLSSLIFSGNNFGFCHVWKTPHADVYDYSSDDVIGLVFQPELPPVIILGPNHSWRCVTANTQTPGHFCIHPKSS